MYSYRPLVCRPRSSRDVALARLIAHLRTPLYRNGYALVLSSATTSVLGVAYWILAARTYTPDTVGLNSAAISAMMFLAGVSQLNLMSALLRFIPGAGRATGRFVGCAYLISVSVAAVSSLIFLGGLGTWAPTLSFLGSRPGVIVWFTLATMAWCIFVLQDSVLTGLRQATWVPVENAAFSLAKIALLVGFATALPHYGVLASWTIAMALTLLPVNGLILRRLIPKHVAATHGDVARLVPAQVARYVAGDYLGSLCWLASTTLLPIMVTQQAGATANAYFFLSWQMAIMLYAVSPNVGSALIVEAATDPTKLGPYSYRVCVQAARIVVPLAAIGMLGAPYVLRLFGPNYAAEGTALLRLLALSALPHIVNSLYISVARVQRRVRAIVIVLASLCALVLILSHILLQRYGITGVGVAWLVSQTIIAVILWATQLRPLWSSHLAAGELEKDKRTTVESTRPSAPQPQDGDLGERGDEAPSTRAQEQPERVAARHDLGGVAQTGGNPSGRVYHDLVMGGVHGVAVGLRLLPPLRLLGRMRDYPSHRRRVAVATKLLPEILPAIMPLPDTPPPATWTVHRIAATDSDKTAITIGPSGRPPAALLKLASTDDSAMMRLRQQVHILTMLHADGRLAEWRALVPTLLAVGEIEGHAYIVQQLLPGREATSVLSSPAARARMQVAAAAAIGELHRLTAASVVVDAGMLERWIDAPLQVVRHVTATLPRAAGNERAIERLATELREALAGRTLSVCTVHGDFVPGNILVTPDGAALTGIVDWELAAHDDLPLLDLLLLLLCVRMVVHRCELGNIVRALLDGAEWTHHERALVEAAEVALPGDAVGMRAMVLLCWLRYVAASLRKSQYFAGHRLWMMKNIEAVLQSV
jgi:aminoglycoside phosphotransferase (APT) family kinase protein/O-antigen/teichoic acid export membrane protein